jgi:hypothetical protein
LKEEEVPVEMRLPIVQAVSLGDYLQGYKLQYAPMIEKALAHSYSADDNIEAVHNKVLSGKASVASITVGDDLVGLAILDTMNTKKGAYLNVWTLTGRHMDVWLADFIEYLEKWAKLLDYKGVMCGGRNGWTKRLKKFGWKQTAVIMQREL